MEHKQDADKSGYTSPDMPPTPATSHRLKRSASSETVATSISFTSSASLNYPNPPRNTPATMSVVGDMDHASEGSIGSLDTLTRRLAIATPPSSPPTIVDAASDRDSDKNSPEEGKPKPHLRASVRVREDSDLGPQLFKAAERKHHSPIKSLLSRYDPDRQATPTRLCEVVTHDADEPPVFEYSAWALVAEEDTMRALQRMAMLARDEHAKDPRFSVEQHYSSRLARLIGEAEVKFDHGYFEQE
ncbi:hypothetical protein Q7P37_010061 [Cladosporium fusiforme]